MVHFIKSIILFLLLYPFLSIYGQTIKNDFKGNFVLIEMNASTFMVANIIADDIDETGAQVGVIITPKFSIGWIDSNNIVGLSMHPRITKIHTSTVPKAYEIKQNSDDQVAIRYYNSVVNNSIFLKDKYNSTPMNWKGKGCAKPKPISQNSNSRGRNSCNDDTNSEYMIGDVACCLFFIESNGMIDADTYTWTIADEDSIKSESIDSWAIWSYTASQNGQSVTATIYSYDHTLPSVIEQSYEPVTRPTSDDYLWINEIMGNLGYTTGTHFDRVHAFNTWLKGWANTDWAYSTFIAYNPSPASTSFTNGSAAYAYLGGPYTQLLFRSFTWQFNLVLGHETAHIFHALDEYSSSPPSNCTETFNGIVNSNYQGSPCNGIQACVMINNSFTGIGGTREWNLCTQTPSHLGWSNLTPVASLIVPSNNAIVGNGNISFSWNRNTTNSSIHSILKIIDTAGSVVVYCQDLITASSDLVNLSVGNYEWTVVNGRDIGNGGYAEVTVPMRTLTVAVTPPNDDCVNSILLIPNTTCIYTSGYISGATKGSLTKLSCDGFINPALEDVWYKFQATSTAHDIIVDPSSGFDPVIGLYTSCTGGEIGCADIGGGGFIETINATSLTIGITYYIRIYDYGSIPPSTNLFDICIVTTGLAPIANFNVSSTAICTGSCVNFTDLSTNNPTSWSWTFTGGIPSSSTSQNPTSICYNTAGTYSVSLTASNTFGSDTVIKTTYITVNPLPVAEFTASNTIINVNDCINFTDLSTGNPSGWLWSFNGGSPSSSSSKNPTSICYNAVGNYQVSLTATSSCGTDVETKSTYINVGLPPVVDFTVSSTNNCTGSCVNFNDLSTSIPSSWSWSFIGGTPNSSTLQNPVSICYNTAGTYSVSLIANNIYGSDTLIKTTYITIDPLPVADFTSSNTNINVNDCINFTDLSTGIPTAWAWSFIGGNLNTSSSQNPNFICYNAVGNYPVSLTVTNSCGTDVQTKSTYINVGIAPVANFSSNSTIIKVGDDVNFFDLSVNNPTAWSWIFTNGVPATSTDQNPTNIKYNTSGCFDVVLKATNAYGTDTKIDNCYIDVMTGVHTIIPETYINIIPNPNTGEFILDIEISQAQDLNIIIVNVLGQKIYYQMLGDISGKYQHPINLRGHPIGLYFLQISTDSGTCSRKVIIK